MFNKLQKTVSLFRESPYAFFVLLIKNKPWALFQSIRYSVGQLFCITVLKFSGYSSYTRINSSVPWIIILSNEKTFLKISWRKDNIIHEINNINLLSNLDQLRSLLIPFSYKKFLWYSVIETQRKYPIPDDNELFNAAERILERLQNCAELRTNCKIDNFRQLTKGLKIINEICGKNEWQICSSHINELLFQESLYIGPTHGDFHPKNILQDLFGNYFIIDLDCVRHEGILALDAIYFINEYYANKNQISWYDQLILFTTKKQMFSDNEVTFLGKFCRNFDNHWLLMYFLDRIGQDSQYVSRLSEMPLREIVKFLNIYKKTQN